MWGSLQAHSTQASTHRLEHKGLGGQPEHERVGRLPGAAPGLGLTPLHLRVMSRARPRVVSSCDAGPRLLCAACKRAVEAARTSCAATSSASTSASAAVAPSTVRRPAAAPSPSPSLPSASARCCLSSSSASNSDSRRFSFSSSTKKGSLVRSQRRRERSWPADTTCAAQHRTEVHPSLATHSAVRSTRRAEGRAGPHLRAGRGDGQRPDLAVVTRQLEQHLEPAHTSTERASRKLDEERNRRLAATRGSLSTLATRTGPGPST